MKITQTLPAPSMMWQPRVKKFLMAGIIYLTSEKFAIFASVTAAAISYIGVLLENDPIIALGGATFIIGAAPHGIRETARDSRQEKRGMIKDKW